jgi:hypothetical protein
MIVPDGNTSLATSLKHPRYSGGSCKKKGLQYPAHDRLHSHPHPGPAILRILQVNTSYGGGERCSRELLERLPALGVETRLWVAQGGPADPPPPKVVVMRRPWEDRLGARQVK